MRINCRLFPSSQTANSQKRKLLSRGNNYLTAPLRNHIQMAKPAPERTKHLIAYFRHFPPDNHNQIRHIYCKRNKASSFQSSGSSFYSLLPSSYRFTLGLPTLDLSIPGLPPLTSPSPPSFYPLLPPSLSSGVPPLNAARGSGGAL